MRWKKRTALDVISDLEVLLVRARLARWRLAEDPAQAALYEHLGTAAAAMDVMVRGIEEDLVANRDAGLLDDYLRLPEVRSVTREIDRHAKQFKRVLAQVEGELAARWAAGN